VVTRKGKARGKAQEKTLGNVQAVVNRAAGKAASGVLKKPDIYV